MSLTSTQSPRVGAEAPQSAGSARRIPTWSVAVAGLFATLPFITRRVGDPDYWWHTLTGRIIVQSRGLVRSELYSYTVHGTPWTDHEYGSQLVFYALTRVGGLLGVAVFFAAVIWGGFILVLARMRERIVSPVVAGAALVLGAGAGFSVWNPRAQMFDFPFLALELWWVERFLRRGSRSFYFLPLLVLLWANLHGGFVFAFYVLGILVITLAMHWLRERTGAAARLLGRALLVCAGCVVASLITPWGFALFTYVWKTQFSSQQSSFIAEWQSPDFHMLNVVPFEIMLLLVFVGFVWRRPSLYEALLVVSAAVLAFDAVRFIEVFVVVTAPILAWEWTPAWRRLTAWMLRTGASPAPTVAVRVTTLALAALVALGSLAFGADTLHGQAASTRANYPVGAADWLAAHPSVGNRMFNQYDWGGYLAYRFYPQRNRRVFIYGEAELMGDKLLSQYVDVNQLRCDWLSILAAYGVDYVIFAPDKPLDAALAASGWALRYHDQVADIWLNTSPHPPEGAAARADQSCP